MKINDLIKYEADLFVVENINGTHALIHRQKTKADLRVIQPSKFKFNKAAGVWEECPEVDTIKEEGRF